MIFSFITKLSDIENAVDRDLTVDIPLTISFGLDIPEISTIYKSLSAVKSHCYKIHCLIFRESPTLMDLERFAAIGDIYNVDYVIACCGTDSITSPSLHESYEFTKDTATEIKDINNHYNCNLLLNTYGLGVKESERKESYGSVAIHNLNNDEEAVIITQTLNVPDGKIEIEIPKGIKKASVVCSNRCSLNTAYLERIKSLLVNSDGDYWRIGYAD